MNLYHDFLSRSYQTPPTSRLGDMNVNSLKRAAMRGSHYALAKLAEIVETDDSTFPQLLPVLCHNIRTLDTPSMDTNATVRHHSLVIAKECFRPIQASLSKKHRHAKAIVDQIAAVVPHICRWIIYFYWSYFLNATTKAVLTSEIVDLRDQFKDILVALIDILSVTFASVMRASPGFIKCMTRVWIHFDSNIESATAASCWDVVDALAYDESAESNKIHSEFVDVLNESADVVAYNCMRRIILDLQLPPVHAITLRDHISIIAQYSTCSDTLRRSFLRAKSVRWCCRLMSHLASRRNPVDVIEHFPTMGCVSVCCHVLAESFQDGYSWVAEALDHHLLESILKCQPLLDSNADVNKKDDTESLLIALLDLVNSYLIYRPVLRSARRSIRHILETSLEDDFDQDGPLWDAWDRLKDVYDLRWETREDLAAQEVTRCTNPECTTPERALRQCSGCSNAYFCDPVCQRIAWRHGHKESCHEQQDERRAGYAKRITDRDISFFYAVAEYDIRVDNSIIGKLQTDFLKQHRTSSTSLLHSLVICFDYESVPHTIKISTADNFIDQCESRVHWKRLVDDSKARKGYLVFITVPSSRSPFTSFTVLGVH